VDKSKLTNVWHDNDYFLAFGFGTGLLPVAPGTWGTLPGIPLVLLMSSLSAGWYLSITIIAFIYGCIICDKVSNDLQVHDYSGIVWDEVVGYMFTLYLVPISWVTLLFGFLFFRLFDIWKPFPIKMIDSKVKGGLGIMLDDVLAAIPAWLCLQLIVWMIN